MKKVDFLLTILMLSFSAFLCANPIPSGSALTLVAPTTITQPGNYRLGNDLSGTVTIAASKVELNLENKCLSNADANCIEVSNQSDVLIKNGVIQNGFINGILIDTCTNISILDIAFIGSPTGLAVLTTTCVKVENCTFRDHSIHTGALFSNSNDGVVTNCKFKANNFGIMLESTRNFVLSHLNANENVNAIQLIFSSDNNTLIKNNTNDNSNDGILIIFSNNNSIIENNVINNGNDGILLNTSNNNTFKKNTVLNSGDEGITLVTDCNNNIFEENTSNNNGANGFAVGGNNHILTENYALNNQEDGICVLSSNNCVIDSNLCNLNTVTGIRLFSSDGNTVRNNICNDNGADGISFNASCNDNTVTENAANRNGSIGINNTGINNSFFFNRAQQNGPIGINNFSGVPNAVIAEFDLSKGDFVETETNLRIGLNISIIP